MAERFIDSGGITRHLGNIAPPAGLVRAWKPYGVSPNAPMVPRAEWPSRVAAFDPGPDFPYLSYTHDQDGIGQCNPEAVTAAIESCRLEQGLPPVKLSPADLYDRINGGGDNGSGLEDAMHEAMVRGVGLAATCGLIWHKGMKTAPGSERLCYRGLEAFLCPTFDHAFSAIICGFRLITGIVWYEEYNPGPNGMLPRGRIVAGGHAIMGYKPAIINGVPAIWHNQSWGNWGPFGGPFLIPEWAYGKQIGGLWALRNVVDEGGVVSPMVPSIV